MDRRRAAAALLALAACIATSQAAPTISNNHTALEVNDGPSEGCYYNFRHYGEGDRIMTNEPCLNCTCHNRMLMCYLRVCPFTKAIGQDCTVEKRADQCCPIVTCPDVPVDLLTSTSTTSPAEYGGTGIGRVDKYGCSIDGRYFSEGAKVPQSPNKPCEHCYCIRNMTTCVMQECTLHVDGCTPIYHKDVCCPVRYHCDHPDDEIPLLDDMTTTVRPTPGFLLTTPTPEGLETTTVTPRRDCIEDDQLYPDGALIKTEKPCEHCYCMKGDIVCVVQECGTPMENEGKNCTALSPRDGQCCPDTYICEGDEVTTELTPESPFTEYSTLVPPRRAGDEGSGYRNEDEIPFTEAPTFVTEIEGSGEEQMTGKPDDLSDVIASDMLTTKAAVEESPETTSYSAEYSPTTKTPVLEVKEEATTEPDMGLNTVPSDIHDEESSVPSLIEKTTPRGEIGTTEPSEVSEKESIEPSTLPELSSKDKISTTEPSLFDDLTTIASELLNNRGTESSLTDITVAEEEQKVTESSITIQQQGISTETVEKETQEQATEGTTIKDTLKTTVSSQESSTIEEENPSIMQKTTLRDESEPTEPSIISEIATVSDRLAEVDDSKLTTLQESVTTDSPVTDKLEVPIEKQEPGKIPEPSIYEESSPGSITSVPSEEETSTQIKFDKTTQPPTLDETSEKEEETSLTTSDKISSTPFPSSDITLPSEDETSAPTFDHTTESAISSTTSEEDTSPVMSEKTTLSPVTSIVSDEEASTPSIPEKTSQSAFPSVSPEEETSLPISFEKTTSTSPIASEEEKSETELDKTTESVLPEYSSEKESDSVTQGEPEETSTSMAVPTTVDDSKITDYIASTDVEHTFEQAGALTTEPAFRREDEGSPPRVSVSEKETDELLTTLADENQLIDTSTEAIVEQTDYETKLTTLHETQQQEDIKPKETTTESFVELSTFAHESKPEKDAEMSSETPVSETESEKTELPETTTIAGVVPISSPGRIPGEGDCLLDGTTYVNNSVVPSINKCHSSCKCESSIIKCDPIICSPQPEYMDNCTLTYDTPDACCPTYVCEHIKETLPPQSQSQTNKMPDAESSTPSPSIECHSDECEVSELDERQSTETPLEICSSDDCQGKPEMIPVETECGPEGCDKTTQPEEMEPEGCTDSNCAKPVESCAGEKCSSPPTKEQPQLVEQVTPKPCEDQETCMSGQPDVSIPECKGESCVSITDQKLCEGDKCDTTTLVTSTDVATECTNGENCLEVPVSITPLCEGDSCIVVKDQTSEEPCDGDQCETKTEITPARDEPKICEGLQNCEESKIPAVVPCSGESCVAPIQPSQEEDCAEETGCKRVEYKPVSGDCTGQDCKKEESVDNRVSSECKDADCSTQKPILHDEEQFVTESLTTESPILKETLSDTVTESKIKTEEEDIKLPESAVTIEEEAYTELPESLSTKSSDLSTITPESHDTAELPEQSTETPEKTSTSVADEILLPVTGEITTKASESENDLEITSTEQAVPETTSIKYDSSTEQLVTEIKPQEDVSLSEETATEKETHYTESYEPHTTNKLSEEEKPEEDEKTSTEVSQLPEFNTVKPEEPVTEQKETSTEAIETVTQEEETKTEISESSEKEPSVPTESSQEEKVSTNLPPVMIPESETKEPIPQAPEILDQEIGTETPMIEVTMSQGEVTKSGEIDSEQDQNLTEHPFTDSDIKFTDEPEILKEPEVFVTETPIVHVVEDKSTTKTSVADFESETQTDSPGKEKSTEIPVVFVTEPEEVATSGPEDLKTTKVPSYLEDHISTHTSGVSEPLDISTMTPEIIESEGTVTSTKLPEILVSEQVDKESDRPETEAKPTGSVDLEPLDGSQTESPHEVTSPSGTADISTGPETTMTEKEITEEPFPTPSSEQTPTVPQTQGSEEVQTQSSDEPSTETESSISEESIKTEAPESLSTEYSTEKPHQTEPKITTVSPEQSVTQEKEMQTDNTPVLSETPTTVSPMPTQEEKSSESPHLEESSEHTDKISPESESATEISYTTTVAKESSVPTLTETDHQEPFSPEAVPDSTKVPTFSAETEYPETVTTPKSQVQDETVDKTTEKATAQPSLLESTEEELITTEPEQPIEITTKRIEAITNIPERSDSEEETESDHTTETPAESDENKTVPSKPAMQEPELETTEASVMSVSDEKVELEPPSSTTFVPLPETNVDKTIEEGHPSEMPESSTTKAQETEPPVSQDITPRYESTTLPEISVTEQDEAHSTESPVSLVTKLEEPLETGQPQLSHSTESPVSLVTKSEEPSVTEQPQMSTESQEPTDQEHDTNVPEDKYTISSPAETQTEGHVPTTSPEITEHEEIQTEKTEPVETTIMPETDASEIPMSTPAPESDLEEKHTASPILIITESEDTKTPETMITEHQVPVNPESDISTTERQFATESVPKETVSISSAEVEESTKPQAFEIVPSSPKPEYSETTPYLVELEEHTHKVEEEPSTQLPEEFTVPPKTQETKPDHKISEISTEQISPEVGTEPAIKETETPLQEKDSVTTDVETSGILGPETTPVAFDETSEKSTELPSLAEEPLTETPVRQELDERLSTESQKEEIPLSTSKTDVDQTTPSLAEETEKPVIPVDQSVVQTDKETAPTTEKPTVVPFETTPIEEEFIPAKTTTATVEEELPSSSPATEQFSKPEEKPSEISPSTAAPEELKPDLSDLQPTDEVPLPDEDGQFPPSGGYNQEPDYVEEDQAFGPGTCRYGGKVYVSAQQIPRDDPCDFCFCFRSDIICLQQSCPPPIHGCHEEPIQGFCCPRYECPVSMATSLNVTTTTTTTTTTLPPHFLPHAYKGAAQRRGCQIKGHTYKVGEVVRASSGPCLHCTCGGDGQMKCDPKACTPEPMLRQMIAAAVSAKRRR